MVDETQILWPQEYADTFKQNLTCIFLSVRGILKETFQCETPCTYLPNLEKNGLTVLNLAETHIFFRRYGLK